MSCNTDIYRVDRKSKFAVEITLVDCKGTIIDPLKNNFLLIFSDNGERNKYEVSHRIATEEIPEIWNNCYMRGSKLYAKFEGVYFNQGFLNVQTIITETVIPDEGDGFDNGQMEFFKKCQTNIEITDGIQGSCSDDCIGEFVLVYPGISQGGGGTDNYEDLINKPKINGQTLIGDITIDKAFIGLNNVDNTSDLNKPISISTQTALDNKQDKLTAGDNITISDNGTISAHVETGLDNISVENGTLTTISGDGTEDNPIKVDLVLPEEQSGINELGEYFPIYSKNDINTLLDDLEHSLTLDEVLSNGHETENIAVFNTETTQVILGLGEVEVKDKDGTNISILTEKDLSIGGNSTDTSINISTENGILDLGKPALTANPDRIISEDDSIIMRNKIGAISILDIPPIPESIIRIINEMFKFDTDNGSSTADLTARMTVINGGRNLIEIFGLDTSGHTSDLIIKPVLGFGSQFNHKFSQIEVDDSSGSDVFTTHKITIQRETFDTQSIITIPKEVTNFNIQYWLHDGLTDASYWIDLNGNVYPFALENTPIGNFQQNTTTILINGIIVNRDDIQELVFGTSYNSITSLSSSRYFCYTFSNLRKIDLKGLKNVTVVDTRSFLGYCNSLREIQIGSWDFINFSDYSTYLISVPNNSDCKLYADSIQLANYFRKGKLTNWKIIFNNPNTIR